MYALILPRDHQVGDRGWLGWCPVLQALPGRIIKASSLSSNPLPNPSRSHSPPISSNSAMLSLSLPCIDPAFEWLFANPVTPGICGGGSDEAQVVKDERGTIDVGVDARRSE